MANQQPQKKQNLSLIDIMLEMEKLKDIDLQQPTEDKSDEAMDWYEEFAVEAYQDITQTTQLDTKTKKQILLNSVPDFYDPKKRAGMMYTFMYTAETQSLDYWDMFPLVLRMLDESDSTESFLGINFHYLEPKYRRILLLNLMAKMAGDETNKESRILSLNMNRLRLPANRYGRVCIRRYKYDNIRGKILRIPPELWIKMIYLPTYRFIGSKPNRIWRDSFKKIRKLGYKN
jgi:hypothetical protein